MVAVCPLLLALVSCSAVCANPEPEPGLDSVVTDVLGSLLTGSGSSGGCDEGGLLGVVDNLVDDLLGGGGGCDGDGGLVGDLLGGLLGGGGGGGGGRKGKGGGHEGGLIEGVDNLLGGVLNVVDDLLGDGISINVGAGGGEILGVDVGDLVDLAVGGSGCGCGDDHSVQLELLGNVLDLTLGGDGNIKNNRGSLLNLDVLDGLIDIGVGNGGGGGGGGGGRRRRGGRNLGNKNCYNVETIDVSVNDQYCTQPLFVNFLPKTEAHTLIDNVCYTYFPLPDDPFTFNLYRATVFCDGSSRIETAIITELSPGRSRIADPFCTMSANVLGYAGCDTYVIYRCMEFGECACENNCPNIIGLSASCAPLGLSCIQKVEEIIDSTCLPRPDFVILPMKLSNRCVTQQICINNIKGNFYRALNLPAPGPVPVII